MKASVLDKIVKVVLCKTNISATQKENASSAKEVDSYSSVYATSQTILI